MPEKYVVPQFIDSEDKILGPITVRQFVICLIGTGVLFIMSRIFTTWLFLLTGLPTAVLALVFAFLKVNGHPFHIFFVNFLQTKFRPVLRVWNKDYNDAEIRAFVKSAEIIPEQIQQAAKARPASTRLRDLALTVNTGGVYNAEDDVHQTM